MSTRTWLTLLLAVAAAVLAGRSANAGSGLCDNGQCAQPSYELTSDARHVPLSTTASLIELADNESIRRAELSDQEYFSFSGVGAIVCTVNGQQRMATAFLVGAFDIGVTVAHTFVDKGVWVQPENCVYTTTDSVGQIRERIPVAYIKAQWEAEAGAYGQLAKDFAVIRLVEPSRFAQRTMPLGKFSGLGANVLMIGFKADMDTNTMKLKTRGTVYERKANGLAISNLVGFTHDMDARDIAPGAPVIDERSGVIIGIHTRGRTTTSGTGATRNTMITMNEWLETTLRMEMQSEKAAARMD
jgi:V8-like Glu-specific endopeptidase